MQRNDQRLLPPRPSSELSREPLGAVEEDTLLDFTAREQLPGETKKSRWRRRREIATFVWASLATLIVVILSVLYQRSQAERDSYARPQGKRNLIFMISDGMGPTSMSLARSFKQYREGLPYSAALTLDARIIGQSRTRSTSSLITDSAAGATAFSCGKKSYNGAISTLPDHTPCGSVMEAAKKAGYMTGLVVTTRITDATPACFAAHVNMRTEEDRIAEQLLGEQPLGRIVDLMLGAGLCHFLPNTSEGSCRGDERDMIAVAKNNGFMYVENRKDFDAFTLENAIHLPLLGLFANGDIPYEIDRVHEKATYPSLAEMTKTALTALSKATKHQDKGFFLMIEGSRIDHAGHANDAPSQVHEVIAYDQAVQEVLDFLDKDSVPGLMLSTSDHETGGLSTAKQLHPFIYPEYRWFPGIFTNATHSTEWLTNDYHRYLQKSTKSETTAANKDTAAYIRKALVEHLGVHDATDEEVEVLVSKPEFAIWTFADIIDKRSQTGWSTHGHSGADVNIYASDSQVARKLIGNHENTEVGDFLREYLNVDVDAVTKELNAATRAWKDADELGSWMGLRPDVGETLDGGSHLDQSQHDPRRHKRCSICNV